MSSGIVILFLIIKKNKKQREKGIYPKIKDDNYYYFIKITISFGFKFVIMGNVVHCGIFWHPSKEQRKERIFFFFYTLNAVLFFFRVFF